MIFDTRIVRGSSGGGNNGYEILTMGPIEIYSANIKLLDFTLCVQNFSYEVLEGNV